MAKKFVKKSPIKIANKMPIRKIPVKIPNKVLTKSTVKRISVKAFQGDEVNKILVENFVALQRVMTNLSVKFDNLSTQISKLLELFEISAKTIAQKDFDINSDKASMEIGKKLDLLLDQNRVIARGLTLLHEPPHRSQPQKPQGIPQMRVPPRKQGMGPEAEIGGYQKSISSREDEAKP